MKHTTSLPLKSLNIAIASAILGLGAASTAQAQSPTNGKLATTATGKDAVVAGKLNTASGDLSTISGGTYNSASGDLSTISGGAGNQASKIYSSIGGGFSNQATGANSTVAGGYNNQATGDNSTVAGGYFNKATGVGSFATGVSNHATGGMSTVSGGGANKATGGQSSIGGGVSNEATGDNSTVAGGYMNKAIGEKSTIAGGSHNEAKGKGSFAAGIENKANTENAVAVGKSNIIKGTNSAAIGSNNTVAEGQKDVFILGSNTTNAQSGSVLLGNKTTGKQATTVDSTTVGNLNLTGFAGASKADNGVVSVGSEGNERQIVNVGAGNISATSTDAVNGSQLHALATAVANNNESIDDLYEANAENVERLIQVDDNVFVNRLNIQELERKQENDIQQVVEMQKAIAEQADINKNDIQDLAKAQLAGVEVMTELNKNVEKNKSNIKTLAQAQLESVTFLGEQIQENKDDISAVTRKAFQNQVDIQRNNDSIDDLYEANNENVERLVEHDRAIEILAEAGNHHDELIRNLYTYNEHQDEYARQQTDEIENLIQASSANTDRISTAELGIAENKKDALIAKAQANQNKADITTNKANIQNLAKAQLAGAQKIVDLNKNIAGTQTDVANNKITLAQHAKKINDNQQAIEAKLGGKVDLQKLEELKTSVDTNQAGIKKNTDDINNLGRANSTNTANIAKNTDDITKNTNNIQNLTGNIQNLKAQVDRFPNSADVQDLKRNQENLKRNQDNLGKVSSENTQNIEDLIAYTHLNDENDQQQTEAIDALNKASSANTKRITTAELGIAENKKDALIAKAQADKNKADIANNINNIYELAQQQDQHGSDIKTLAKASAANKADADAKFKGVQTDIANNKITLAQHAKKINDNQQAIEAKLSGKVDTQKLVDLETKVDERLATVQENYSELNTQVQSVDNKIGMVDTRINALDDKVENSMAAQAALNGLFQPYNVGKVSVSVAVGAYGSKSAIAVGAGYRVNPHLAFKGGVAINTSGSRKGSYNLGINYEF